MPNPDSTCKGDPARLAVFKDCMDTVGMDDHAPESQWPWNVISKRAVAYDCGQIARDTEVVTHHHDADEFALCRRLAARAEALMSGRDVGMGSESSDPLRAYYRVVNSDDTVSKRVSEALIRDAFGGTIYPPTEIVVEPLQEAGDWWRQVAADGSGIGGYLEPWRKMIAWFHDQPELHDPSFVMIGEDPLDPQFKNGGCVFPRMAVALTSSGSLVGIAGWVVHT